MTDLNPDTIDEKIFILVGGLGTRLRSVVSDVPKPMAPVEGKPFLWYKLQQLKSVGFRNFVFCAGYLSEIIEDYFHDGKVFGVKIEYSHEDKRLGTAGAMWNARDLVDGPFFMCNGDTYLNFNPHPMLNFIEKKDAKYVMLLTEPHEKGQEGVVSVDEDDRIKSFVEKPDDENLLNQNYINAGIYYLHPDVIDLIPADQKVSIEREIFPKMLEKNTPFYGYEYEGYFIDIGIPKNYDRFCDDVKSGKISFD